MELHAFWRVLESVDADGAVLAQWRHLLGAEFDVARPFLRPLNEPAHCYPCLRAGGCGSAHQLVSHGRDDHVAVCDPDVDCAAIALRDEDLVLYEFHLGVLVRELCTGLRLQARHGEIEARSRALLIGEHVPTAGFRFPVYLVRPLDSAELHVAVTSLVSQANGPFILLMPTHDRLNPTTKRLLEHAEATLIALDEATRLAPGQSLALALPVEDLFSALQQRALPDRPKLTAMFPTPASATWSDLAIRFTDRHTVSVRVGEVSRVLNYSQMGMADGRTNRPTKQWELLHVFAEGQGTLDWSSPGADRRNQKRRELLARDLRRFFRIDSDPFRTEGRGWQARFSVCAEA